MLTSGILQLDVNTTFLQKDLQDEVYMTFPPSVTLSSLGQVCKLQKSLYGLKQASRQWNCKLTEAFLSYGYTQSKADYSLFVKFVSNRFTVVLVDVDDLSLTGNTFMKSIKSNSFCIIVLQSRILEMSNIF